MRSIKVARSSMPDYAEYCEEIRDLWDSRWLTNMGMKHQQLQSALEQRLGAAHVALLQTDIWRWRARSRR